MIHLYSTPGHHRDTSHSFIIVHTITTVIVTKIVTKIAVVVVVVVAGKGN